MDDLKPLRACRTCHGAGVIRQYKPMPLPDFAPLIGASEQEIVAVHETVPCPECVERRASQRACEGRELPKDSEGNYTITEAGELAHWLNSNLAEGMAIKLPDSFTSGLLFNPITYPSLRDALMSNLVGSGYGAWEIAEDFEHDSHTVSRHPTGDEITYVDPDRRHLYRRTWRGTYEPIPERVERYLSERRKQ